MSSKIYTNKNENFTIICKKCGSKSVEIGKEFWYDFEDKLSMTHSVILCKSCGFKEEI